MMRGRNIRTRNVKGHLKTQDDIRLDFTKDATESVCSLLKEIISDEATKSKKLACYNAFVRLWFRLGAVSSVALTKDELALCLRQGLFSSFKEIRAASLRSFRYFCQDCESLAALMRIHVDYLIARSLDICIDNDVERVQAVRLIRKILSVCPKHFPASLVTVLVSIANDGAKERDKLVKTCLATLCEVALCNASVVVQHGGIATLLDNTLHCHQQPRINESLIATVLCLINHPHTRTVLRTDVDLEVMLAPFTDVDYKYGYEPADQSAGEESEFKFDSCKMALSTVMKSWPGLMWMCKPDGSGLQSLIGMLYLPNMQTRKEIADVLFDVFRLPVPVWTENITQALLSTDPSEMNDKWRLGDGFVAEEAKSLLPYRTKTRPNLVDNHAAFTLSVLIKAGLLEALVEVIATSDKYLSTRCAILLGELLYLSNCCLPGSKVDYLQCLPALIERAANFKGSSDERHRATGALNCLKQLDKMKHRSPVPCSLFLDHCMRCAHTNSTAPVHTASDKDCDREFISLIVRDCHILSTEDNHSWDWLMISAALKWPDDSMKNLEEGNCQRFINRLVFFFKPRNKMFSIIDLSRDDHRRIALAGLDLIDFLLNSHTEEAELCAKELLSDMKECLLEAVEQHAIHDAPFAAFSLLRTCSQFYFLFIGHFSSSSHGSKLLDEMSLYQTLLKLMSSACQDVYIKLIVSCLDYTKNGPSRTILSQALTATSDNARLYATSFMRVILRTISTTSFVGWAIEFLVKQLSDASKPVAMEALSVLSEACEDPVYLEYLARKQLTVGHLGDKGHLLLARFLSSEAGFSKLSASGYVATELTKWHTHYNIQYVHIVEERLSEALTTYEKTYDGSYVRRSHRRMPRKDVFLPVHLYGQLVQHEAGATLLESQPYLSDIFDTVRYLQLKTPEQVLKLKAALWAVGNIGRSVFGCKLLEKSSVIGDVIKLAQESGVYTIRGTAFYVLGLISSTQHGVQLLKDFNWESVCHSRNHQRVNLVDSALNKHNLHSNLLYNSTRRTYQRLDSDNSADIQLCYQRLDSNGSHDVDVMSGHHSEDNRSLDSNCKSLNSADEKQLSDQTSPCRHTGDDKSLSDPGSSCQRIGDDRSVGDQANTCHRISDKKPAVDASGDGRSSLQQQDASFDIASDADLDKLLRRPKLASSSRQPTGDSNVGVGYCRTNNQQQLTDDQYVSSNQQVVLRHRLPSVNEGVEIVTLHAASCSPQQTLLCSEHSAAESQDNNMCVLDGVFTAGSLPDTTSSVGVAGASVFRSTVVPVSSAQSLHVTDNGSDNFVRKYDSLQQLTTGRHHQYTAGVRASWTGVSTATNSDTATSAQDLHGYATLRRLNRPKTNNMDVADGRQSYRTSDYAASSYASKTRSLDFRTSKLRSSLRNFVPKGSFREKVITTCGSILRPRHTLSTIERLESTPQIDVSVSELPAQTDSCLLPSTVDRAEFVGICLPAEISVMFQVTDVTDGRSHDSDDNGDVTKQHSCTCSVATDNCEVLEPVSSVLHTDDGLNGHSSTSCLYCCHPLSDTTTTRQCTDIVVEPEGSTEDQAITDIATIRREILRLVVKTSSSVGLRSCEQGLLILKQKFPSAFQDICLYSEICFLLGNYNYRLPARRFIQELFQDLDFRECLISPQSIPAVAAASSNDGDDDDDDYVQSKALEALEQLESDF